MKRDLTKGSIIKSILYLSIPFFFSSLMQSLMETVDMFWIGKLGTDKIAAVSISGSLMFLLFSITFGVNSGLQSLISRYTGAKKYEKAANVFFQGIVIVSLIALFLSIVAILYYKPILGFFSVNQNVYTNIINYMKNHVFGGILIYTILILTTMSLYSVGESITAMVINVVGVVLNIVLDPIFIFGYLGAPKMGIAGASFATVLARFIGLLIAIIYIKKKNLFIIPTRKEIYFDLPTIKDIFAMGIVTSTQITIKSVSFLFLQKFIAVYGTVATAVNGICGMLSGYFFIFSIAFANSCSVMVGQNLGAKKLDRVFQVVKKSVRINFIINLFTVSISYIIGALVISKFDKNPFVIAEGMIYIYTVFPAHLLLSYVFNLQFSFRAAGKTIPNLFITAVSFLFIIIPMSYYFSKVNPNYLEGIWFSLTVSAFIEMVLSIAYYKKSKWYVQKIN